MTHTSPTAGASYQLEKTSNMYLNVKERFSRDIYEKLLKFNSKEIAVAEIGPGLGHFALETVKRGYDYIGFEPSDSLRTNLLEKNIKVIDAFTPPIPLSDGSCDLVYASMIMEHLADHKEASKLSLEIARVLKAGGRTCMVVPNYLTSKNFFFEMDYTHSFITTKRRMANLLRDAGLTVVDVQHIIGWFWVKSGLFHHILRHIINICMVPMHFGFTTWLFEYLGLSTFLWKIRKTLFESLIITAMKMPGEK